MVISEINSNFASKINRSKEMFNLRDAKIEDFKVVENTQQVPTNRKNVHVTFYRVKPGCHKPVAPKLEYCKLSEVRLRHAF